MLPWGKYSHARLPMGLSGAPDIFQERMAGLMEGLAFAKAYLDDILIVTKSTFSDHLAKLELVLSKLQAAGLRVNAPKSSLGMVEAEYLGCALARKGTKPQPEKASAILAIKRPASAKIPRCFLGMAQHCHNWLCGTQRGLR